MAAHGHRLSQQRGTEPASGFGRHGCGEEHPRVCADPGPGHLQRGRHRPGASGLQIRQGIEHRRRPVEVGCQPLTPVAVQQRIQPDMRLAGQMSAQHLCREGQVIPVLVPGTLAPPAAHRRQPPCLTGSGVLPPRGIDVGSGAEKRREERDLRVRRRLAVDRAWSSVEDAGLCRTGWRRLLRSQLQQAQQTCVLRPKLGGQRTQARHLRHRRKIVHATHRRARHAFLDSRR